VALLCLPPLITLAHYHFGLHAEWMGFSSDPQTGIRAEMEPNAGETEPAGEEWVWRDFSNIALQECGQSTVETARATMGDLGKLVLGGIGEVPEEDQQVWLAAILEDIDKETLDQDPATLAYMEDIVSHLIVKEDLYIEVHLVDEEIVNAFAIPGPAILVYQGLLDRLDNEAALAGILAHEVAHIELGHQVELLAALGRLGIHPDSGLANVLGPLIKHGFELESEKAADRQGLARMLQFSYCPVTYIEFLQLLQAPLTEGESDPLQREAEDLLASHPSSQRRACLANNQLAFLTRDRQGGNYYLGRRNVLLRTSQFQRKF
jgi:hypothetical protein